MRIHEPDYDETQGLIVINEKKGHDMIEKTSQKISQIFPDEMKTTQYGDIDIIHDFSYIDELDIKTIMRKS